uniref:Uncharacterized protein n=1 Tax=Amblyomma cajennense TaxID=34607 RepID=A0A023FBI5_AMBCJ
MFYLFCVSIFFLFFLLFQLHLSLLSSRSGDSFECLTLQFLKLFFIFVHGYRQPAVNSFILNFFTFLSKA